MGDIFLEVSRQATPVFNYLLSCSTVRAEITHRKYTGQVFDEATNADKDQYSESALIGVETFHTKESAFASKRSKTDANSEIEVGDRAFIFFSDVECSLKDQIIDSVGVIYNIKAITPIRTIATIITVDS